MADGAGEGERSSFLFAHLIAMFETLALQQLGKLVNPISGEACPDLRQARITIDMVDMIREKTRAISPPDEKRLLDAVLVELQMNYLDESKRAKEGGPGENLEERIRRQHLDRFRVIRISIRREPYEGDRARVRHGRIRRLGSGYGVGPGCVDGDGGSSPHAERGHGRER